MSPDPDPDEIVERLTRLEERFTAWNDEMKRGREADATYKKEAATVHEALAARIATIELWRAKISGISITVGTLSGIFTALGTALILHFLGV